MSTSGSVGCQRPTLDLGHDPCRSQEVQEVTKPDQGVTHRVNRERLRSAYVEKTEQQVFRLPDGNYKNEEEDQAPSGPQAVAADKDEAQDPASPSMMSGTRRL